MCMTRLCVVIAAAVIIGPATVRAQTTLALWQIPVPIPTGAGLVPTGTTYLPPNQTGTAQWPLSGGAFAAGTPTFGILAGDTSPILSVFPASTAATYTSPSSNGSPYAFSSNTWQPNDYYQVVLPTIGQTNLQVGWDEARDSTGPLLFALQMSTDGSSFIQLTTYSVLQSGGAGAPGTWVHGSSNPISFHTFALPDIADNQATLYLRFTNVTGTASSAAAGGSLPGILLLRAMGCAQAIRDVPCGQGFEVA